MGELRDLRTLRVDLSRFCGLHLGFKGGCRGRLGDAGDRAPPGGARPPRRAWLTPPAIAAGVFLRALNRRAHTRSPGEGRAPAARVSPTAAKKNIFGIRREKP